MEPQPNMPGPHGSYLPRTGAPLRHSGAEPVTGLLPATPVLTASGERAAASIRAGDRVVTRDIGLAPVTAVARHRVLSRAILFKAGSLGDTRPESDLVLPAGQMILVRDWRAKALFRRSEALAAAADLVDGEFIRDLGLQLMDVVVLRFDRPLVVYGGGLELAACGRSGAARRPAA